MTEREAREKDRERLGVIENDIQHLVMSVDKVHRDLADHVSRHRSTVQWLIPTLLMACNILLTVVLYWRG